MCKAMEAMCNDAAAEVKYENKIETALRFLAMNLTIEQIAAGTGLSVQKVEALSNSRSA